jgi:hypothetical protein
MSVEYWNHKNDDGGAQKGVRLLQQADNSWLSPMTWHSFMTTGKRLFSFFLYLSQSSGRAFWFKM